MFGLKLKDAKSMFFDRAAVTSAADKATRTVLSKFGTYVRRAARASIKKRPEASLPGKPPSSHTGLLRDFIFFSYNDAERSVVIGPAKLSGKTNAPEVLEHGGYTIITFGKNKGQKKYVKARPYMLPAYESREKELPKLWKDSVK
jgi:hypothetical protein